MHVVRFNLHIELSCHLRWTETTLAHIHQSGKNYLFSIPSMLHLTTNYGIIVRIKQNLYHRSQCLKENCQTGFYRWFCYDILPELAHATLSTYVIFMDKDKTTYFTTFWRETEIKNEDWYTSFKISSFVTGERISIGSSFDSRARNFAVLIPTLKAYNHERQVRYLILPVRASQLVI